MELRGEAAGVKVYDDFAHHPDRDRHHARGAAPPRRARPHRRGARAALAHHAPRACTRRRWPAALGRGRRGLAVRAAGPGLGRARRRWRRSGARAHVAEDLDALVTGAGARTARRRSRADHEQRRLRRRARAAARGASAQRAAPAQATSAERRRGRHRRCFRCTRCCSRAGCCRCASSSRATSTWSAAACAQDARVRRGADHRRATRPAARSRIAAVGTAARIVDFQAQADGLLGLLCRGERRFRVQQRRQQSDGLNRRGRMAAGCTAHAAAARSTEPLASVLRQVVPAPRQHRAATSSRTTRTLPG